MTLSLVQEKQKVFTNCPKQEMDTLVAPVDKSVHLYQWLTYQLCGWLVLKGISDGRSFALNIACVISGASIEIVQSKKGFFAWFILKKQITVGSDKKTNRLY